MKRLDLMPPPWLMYPHILNGSIGWRMGYGEDYLMRFQEWFRNLSDEDQLEYKEMFPGPLDWIGWYGSFDPSIRTRFNMNWVIENLDNGYLFFWGHQPSKNGTITKSCLSQWWKCKFTVGHLTYSSTEQYMMACKARLFRDTDIEKKIMNSDNPKEIKELGRQVQGFNVELWDKNKFDYVVRGNYCKFSQNADLKKYLDSTDDIIIVEASPYDKIWGIGMSETDEGIEDPCNWQGDNLLGFALMKVRESIRQAYSNANVLDFEAWED